jgi:hypothetical protein
MLWIIDFVKRDEIDNVYGLRGFHINAGKIFVLDDDELALFIFIPFTI